MLISQEAKERRDREHEVRDKKIDEQLKHLDQLQTFVFGAMIGVSIAMFREEESFKEDESFKIIGGSVYDYHNYQHFCYSQGNERFALIIGLTYLAKNTLMDWKRRITFNPQQCGGRPCIRGMRIRVTDVLDLLATGLSH